MSATSNMNNDFNFVQSSDVSVDIPITGEMSPLTSPNSDGKVHSYIASKGYGWLLEANEEGEEEEPPLLEELDIDLPDMIRKLKFVLFPRSSDLSKIDQAPDFWGPLMVVLLFSLVSLYGQFRVVSWILTIWLFGSLVISLLARVLGADVSYSQCLGVIGYSLLPLVLSGAILPFVWGRYISVPVISTLAVLWSSYSAASFLLTENLKNKKPLLVYPIFLLYIFFLSLHSGA